MSTQSLSRIAHSAARRTLAGICILTSAATHAGAQASNPHRFAVAVGVEGAGVASEFSGWCTTSRAAGLGIGVTAIVRPREWLSLDVDSRVMKLFPSDCLAIPFPIVARGPGVTEQFLGSRGSPAGPLLLRRSTMHVGLETPRNLPLARVTLGAGALWSRNPLPLGTMAVGLGGRGDGVRFYMEYEYNVSRIRLSDIYERRTEVAGGVRIETISRSTVHHPTWRTVRAGLELPMMWLGMHSPTRPESSRSRQAQAVRPA